MTFLKHHILAVVLIPLVLGAAAVSYQRFLVQEDFIVQYEGSCDPEVQNCYLACEDDECSSVYFYSLVQKYAADVYAQCGPDITDCEAANSCTPEDRYCEIETCSIEDEDCVGPGEATAEEEPVTEDESESVDAEEGAEEAPLDEEPAEAEPI